VYIHIYALIILLLITLRQASVTAEVKNHGLCEDVIIQIVGPALVEIIDRRFTNGTPYPPHVMAKPLPDFVYPEGVLSNRTRISALTIAYRWLAYQQLNNVSPTDNTDNFAVFDDGHPLNAVLQHQLSDVSNVCLLGY